jgi:hypothetical protein
MAADENTLRALIGAAETAVTQGRFVDAKQWQLRAGPALIIGMDILGTLGAITIDFQHQYLYLQGRGVLSSSSADALHSYSILRSGGRHYRAGYASISSPRAPFSLPSQGSKLRH